VAIVGRPNVGKSALFNRLIGRRVAIVHEEAGVTRDRLCSEAVWNDQRFELIDTGGIGRIDRAASADAIESGTRAQVDVALQDAAVVIFVVDVSDGRVALDEEVARLLHQSGRTVLAAVNKCDNDALEEQAVEFEALGFPVFPVSALHGRGVAALVEAALPRLPPARNVTTARPLKVAVVGRPNVGKSSYINRLLRSERVIVSDVPGTTRDSIEIPFTVGKGEQARHYVLIDTAGIRRQRRQGTAVDTFSMMRTESSIEQSDLVVLMLDATQGPSLQDRKTAGKILENRKGCILVINKWDLADEVTQRTYTTALRQAMPFLGFVPVIYLSAKSGYNVRRTVDAIDYVAAQIQTQLTTGTLNRVLQDATQRVTPPAGRGGTGRLKIFYATQTGTQPIRIKLFVNDPKRVTDAYRTYLVNALRGAFGLEGAPVILQFHARPRG